MTGNMDQERLAAIATIALRVVSLRLLIILGLLLDGVMFGWAMWVGGYDRLAIAGAFAAATWTLVHLRRES